MSAKRAKSKKPLNKQYSEYAQTSMFYDTAREMVVLKGKGEMTASNYEYVREANPQFKLPLINELIQAES